MYLEYNAPLSCLKLDSPGDHQDHAVARTSYHGILWFRIHARLQMTLACFWSSGKKAVILTRTQHNASTRVKVMCMYTLSEL
jgi:hypothetical protein